MPEYGRGVQMMVDMAVQLESREERQHCANTIVKIMKGLLPSTASKEDDEHRLWNHLARIAHYKLDIDYPVNIVPQEEVQAHPAPLPYPMKPIKRRHYGYLVEQALDYAKTIEDEEARRFVTESIANQSRISSSGTVTRWTMHSSRKTLNATPTASFILTWTTSLSPLSASLPCSTQTGRNVKRKSKWHHSS